DHLGRSRAVALESDDDVRGGLDRDDQDQGQHDPSQDGDERTRSLAHGCLLSLDQAASAAAAPRPDGSRAHSRSASGFSQNSASPAAATSQTTATQKIGIHDPVISTRRAAPQPAKIAARPLAVYWIP